jgi:hypothetical protein
MYHCVCECVRVEKAGQPVFVGECQYVNERVDVSESVLGKSVCLWQKERKEREDWLTNT